MEVINKLKKNVSDALKTFLSNHTNIEVSIFLEHELRPIITKYTNTQETNAENIQNVLRFKQRLLELETPFYA